MSDIFRLVKRAHSFDERSSEPIRSVQLQGEKSLAPDPKYLAPVPNISTPLWDNGGSFCKVGITADLFDTFCTAFFRFLKFTCFIIILRFLVKDFLTEVKITT